jgi:hypothetical protein
MTIYCTYSDLNYLPRLITLLESLRNTEASYRVLILALDVETEHYFSENPKPEIQVSTISLIQSNFPRLTEARANRSEMEFVFTLTPFLMKQAMEMANPREVAVYLDADLFFFSDPTLVLESMSESDIGIIPHHYPDRNLRRLSRYGTFNVGWVGIRNSENGRKCVEWWSERCLEWCRDEPVEGNYADQGYLDKFPELFKGVKILSNRGFNLAPWNTDGQTIRKNEAGQIVVGEQTVLVFFHFHGLKKLGKWVITSQLNYGDLASKPLIDLVYKPYLRALHKAEKILGNTKSGSPTQKLVRGKGIRRWARTLAGKLLMIASVITGNAVDMSRLK